MPDGGETFCKEAETVACRVEVLFVGEGRVCVNDEAAAWGNGVVGAVAAKDDVGWTGAGHTDSVATEGVVAGGVAWYWPNK